LAIVLRQWQFLAFTALSPLMVMGQATSDRLSSRRANRVARRAYDSATTLARQQVTSALAEERVRRYEEAPSLAEIVDIAARRRPGLWQRAGGDTDALQIRLGRGDVLSEVQVIGGVAPTVATDVPVCLGLAETRVLGICGPRNLTTGLARSIVAQSSVQLGPNDLRVVVIAPHRAQEWSWVRWLPHVTAGDATCRATVGLDDDQAGQRIVESAVAPAASTGRTLLVVDEAPNLRALAATTTLLTATPPRTSIVWCAPKPDDLPAECTTVITLHAAPGPHLQMDRAGVAAALAATPDLLAVDVAATIARSVAAIRTEAKSESVDLPRHLRWEDLNSIDLNDPDSAAPQLVCGWQRPASTAITLGVDDRGPVSIDLCADGPHALIAGTTGSGKSELLVSLIACLAVGNRPDELALLLLDHKGGAALGRCARLPHAIGLVTDLDGESTQRALLSLGAELRRRETVLAAAGASDLVAYRKLSLRDEPLPRLVIVVDEFAALAQEHPEFISGLVGIAARGRSLGVHLILATQRPDGVVSADIRANTRLRICLGVAREQESRDVIDSPAAAAISRATPGRGYLQVGPGDLRQFQAAHVGAARVDRSAVRVVLDPVEMLGDPVARAGEASTAESDLDVLIDAAIKASDELGCTASTAPWLPPLPAELPLSALGSAAAGRQAPWGLIDLPVEGKQVALTIDGDSGHTCLVAGAPRSGRTTAAITWVTAVAARLSPDQLEVWAIDGAAGLAALARLPHCGAVLPARDAERVGALLEYLEHEVARRRERPAASDPVLLLVIDSLEGLTNHTGEHDAGESIEQVARLARDAASVRLHLFITGGRALLAGRIAALATERIVLRLPDPTDFLLIGLSSRQLPSSLPPGRGLRAADCTLVQIAVADSATTERARDWRAPARPIRRFEPMPTRVPLADVRVPTADRIDRLDQLALGADADSLAPVLVTRADIAGAFLALGPPGSGRSTALALLAYQLAALPGDRRVAISCPTRSPVARNLRCVFLPRDDQDHAVAILDSLCNGPAGPPDVFVDDVDLLPDGPLLAELETLLGRGSGADQVIALAATIDAAASSFRGPLALARRAKTGVLLWPSGPHDGDVFGLRLQRRAHDPEPPGRGWFARLGRGCRIQLADPGPGGSQPRTEFELSALGERCRE
jgi:S-DNA-T family DNA segregation ATPase FtsK/SpoIIIE